MAYDGPVFPFYGAGQTVASTSSATTISIPAGAKQLMLTATGGAFNVYVRVTDALDTAVATAADAAFNSVNRLLLSKNPDHTRMSIVSPGGAVSVHVMPCDGAGTM